MKYILCMLNIMAYLCQTTYMQFKIHNMKKWDVYIVDLPTQQVWMCLSGWSGWGGGGGGGGGGVGRRLRNLVLFSGRIMLLSMQHDLDSVLNWTTF